MAGLASGKGVKTPLLLFAVLALAACTTVDLRDASDQWVFEVAAKHRHPNAVEEFLRRYPTPFAEDIRRGELAIGMGTTEAQLAIGWIEPSTNYTDALGSVTTYHVKFNRPGPKILRFVNDRLTAWEG